MNDTDDQISIITCFLNVEHYLTEAIESVIQQTYQNWELWLINDGSTDGGTDIAKKYASQYPQKIFYQEHPNLVNKGASFSRNVAIQQCHGKYLTFLDGDDFFYPTFLENSLRALKNVGTRVIFESTMYWYSWNSASTTKDFIVPVGVPGDQIYDPPKLLEQLYPLGNGPSPCVCSGLIETELIKHHYSFDNQFKGMYDDQIIFAKLYLNEPIFISSTCNNKYRQRPGSLVHDSHVSGNYIQERKDFLLWLRAYLSSSDIEHPGVWKLWRRAYFPYQYPKIHYIIKTLPIKIRRFAGRIVHQFFR